MGAAISLNFDCFSILTRVSESSFFSFFFVLLFATFLIHEMYVRHAVIMAVDVIFHCVHSCRSHMPSFSHIPKRKTGPSLLTPYMDF